MEKELEVISEMTLGIFRSRFNLNILVVTRIIYNDFNISNYKLLVQNIPKNKSVFQSSDLQSHTRYISPSSQPQCSPPYNRELYKYYTTILISIIINFCKILPKTKMS